MYKNVTEYLEELERNEDDKSDQVRDGIEIYPGLWRRALEKGMVQPSGGISDAFAKIEEKGGLYEVAED
jgi:hypothetical protein